MLYWRLTNLFTSKEAYGLWYYHDHKIFGFELMDRVCRFSRKRNWSRSRNHFESAVLARKGNWVDRMPSTEVLPTRYTPTQRRAEVYSHVTKFLSTAISSPTIITPKISVFILKLRLFKPTTYVQVDFPLVLFYLCHILIDLTTPGELPQSILLHFLHIYYQFSLWATIPITIKIHKDV